MLDLLKDRFPYPSWADARYRRLVFLDAILAGDLFNTLRGSFYDDTALISMGRKARLIDRKPSVRYNLAHYVARQTARKLFSGRHAPRFMHPGNEKLALAAEALMREGFLKTRIAQAAVWGSVGSVAVTFAILNGGEGVPRIVFNVYRARMCWPTLDSLGELKSLRLWYVITDDEARKLSKRDFLGNKFRKKSQYWFVRDFLPGREVTYVPVEVGSKQGDVVLDDIIQTMDLKPIEALDFKLAGSTIVPAHWFVNLSGGDFPDGECTWEDAVPGMIEISYTLSQLGRGVRYNATPQLVIVGKTYGEQTPTAMGSPKFSRDATDVLRISAGKKTQQEEHGAGDAKLLEMRGAAAAATLKYVESVRKYSLELIGASRKDPDRLHFPQSGKAMEMLDEDFFDLVGELRTAYGDYGLIPLMKKALTVASMAGHPLLKGVDLGDIDELALRWPRFYAPTAQEFNQFAQGLAVLVTGGKAGQKSGDGAPVSTDGVILSRDEARKRLDEFLDIPPETTSIALQQQPREEVTPVVQPEKPKEGAPGNPLGVKPDGRILPAQTTSLAPKPYTQQ